MDENKKIEKRTEEFRKKGLKNRLILLLSFMVVLSTSYVMIQPGQALDLNPARFFMFLEDEEQTAELDTPAPDTEDPELYESEITEPEETTVVADEEAAGEEETAALEETQEEGEPEEQPAETAAEAVEEEPTAAVEETEPELTEEENAAGEVVATEGEEASEETEEPEAAEVTEEETPAEEAEEKTEEAEALPDWSFEETTDKEDGEEITVYVTAPGEAFPEGTVMKVARVELDKEEMEALEGTVEGEVKQVHAVDISFWNKDENGEDVEIEPAEGYPIQVKMKSKIIQDLASENKEIVHIDNEKNAELVTQADPDKLEEKLEDDEMAFEADKFSVYAIVVIDNITLFTLTNPDDEDTKYLVTVTYDESAQIPEGALLVVTEFDSESEEYAAAREAIVADKLAENPEFDEEKLGMAALDISIELPDGTKVEPASPVKVEIVMKALPEETDAGTLEVAMELQHLKETEDETIEIENVANTYSNYNEFGGNITVTQEDVTATFDVSGFSTFAFIWTDDDLHANVIVHYVDVNGVELAGPQSTDVNVTNNNAVSFSTYQGGISGYTFKEARLDSLTGSVVTGFTPSTGNNRLRFTNGSTTVRDVTRPYNVEVYFIYSPTEYPPGGDEPTLDTPVTDKDLEPAGDGTYTITLSVTGTAESHTDSTKANVVVIYDSSNSMSDETTSYEYVEAANGTWGNFDGTWRELTTQNIWMYNGSQYSGYRYQATTSNSGTQYGIVNGNVQQIYYRNYAWRTTNSNWGTVYNGTRYQRQANNYNSTTSYLLGFVDGQMVNITRESVVGATYNGSFHPLEGPRYNRNSITQSRHEIATDAVTSLATALLANNTEAVPDMVELAFVDFGSLVNTVNGSVITLNNNTLTNAGQKTTSLSTFLGWLNAVRIPDITQGFDNAYGGTDWEEALKVANLFNFNDDDPTYVIFVSDGNPTYRVSQNGNQDSTSHSLRRNGGNNTQLVTFYGTGNSDPNSKNLDAAVVEARNIIKANKKLYTVGAFVVEDNKMPNLGGKDYDAADKARIEAAFNDIVDSITKAMNVANVKITDGITALTANTFVDGSIDANSFRYTKGGAPWNPEDDGAFTAYIDTNEETGELSVKWDLGPDYMLEKGVTYTVSFVVWPKQEAYDLLAALNNGLIEWGDDFTYLDHEGNEVTIPYSSYQSQIVKNGNIYTVMTNTSASLYYEIVNIEDGEEVGERTPNTVPITNPTNGMGLDESHLDVRKEWNDSLDPTQLLNLLTDNLVERDGVLVCDYEVVLHILNDKNEYVPVTIKPNVTITDGKVTAATWPTEKVFIAPGVMLDVEKAAAKGIDTDAYPQVSYEGVTYVILETGHDYTVDEQNTDYHFELRAETYHPMVVDGAVKDVTFIYNTEGEITGIEAIDVVNVGTVVATNELRAGINMRKIVLDAQGNEIYPSTQSFKLKVSLRDKDGQPIKFSDYPGSATSEYFKPDGTTAVAGIDWDTYPIWFNIYYDAKDDLDLNGTYERSPGMVVEDGGYIFLKAGEVIRLANVPIGTQFSFVEEDVPTGYEFVQYEYKAGKTSSEWTTETDIDTGYVDTAIANQSYYLKLTNQLSVINIKVLKVDANSNEELPDAIFDLYPESAIDENGQVISGSTPVDGYTNLTTNEEGIFELSELPLGTYYLIETKAPDGYNPLSRGVKITISADGVSYIQSDNNGGQPQTATSTVEDGVTTYLITITNNPGVMLPNAGGPGTLLYTLGGSALMLAALMYGFRMRRRERRLN